MKKFKRFYNYLPILTSIMFLLLCSSCKDNNKNKGAYYTSEYENLFSDLLGISELKVNQKIKNAFEQLFYGDNSSERVYYPIEPDMAYIHDIINDDVRSEGMSYGMMISVQLNKKEEFDRLWKWVDTFMRHKSGQRENYFAWHTTTDGVILDSNSASDGEIWFVMALYFASARWGDGGGIFNYKNEAQKILDAMLSKEEFSDDPKVITNMFNKKEKQVVFVPAGEADDFTDPSYHVPHYYELWARWADKNNRFWCECASTSRNYFKNAVNPITGLAPDYSHFDGNPINPWGGGSDNFQYDAWRVAMNIAVDFQWFRKDEWAVEQSNRLLNFFYSEGMNDYVGVYTLDGKKKLSSDHNPGLVAMNAVAALASKNENRKEFIEALWNLEIPSGYGRYYDGLLYLIGMLQVSGNFKIHDPAGTVVEYCN